MGIKKTGEVTGASIILLIFFPILIAKLMANKYHKDGFLGMIKATLAVILALFPWIFYKPLTDDYGTTITVIITAVMLFIAIMLFISSSKRSRALARAEMETTNENHGRTEP